LPCVDAMARASWFAALQPVAELALLPVALLSTLAFRVQNESPDAIVLAAGDAPVSGWNQRRSLRAVFADTPTLLLAEQPDAALVRSAARLHVYSVLSMELSAQQLVAAVAATAAGLAVMMPLAPTDAADTTPAMEHLTLREVEVLRLMARGYRNKQVATVLNISEHTVKYHVSSVIAKLGARTRTEAVTIGVMRGLVAI
jgi:NarL family two-component system response regulator YdfI